MITQPAYSEKKFLNVEETAEYLGLSKSYIYQLVFYKQLPYSKPFGKKLYFLRSKLDELLINDIVLSNSEIDQRATDKLLNKE